MITGFLEDFNYRRMGGGEPMIGGYKSFNAKVKVEQVRILNVANGQQMGRAITGEDNKPDRGLGLELFGKERKRDYEFYSLTALIVGSKRFIATSWVRRRWRPSTSPEGNRAVISLPDTNWYQLQENSRCSSSNGRVTINAGSGDGVKAGDRFLVYTADSGVSVGRISITTVWGEHISKAEILEGKDEIRQNDIIMPDVGR